MRGGGGGKYFLYARCRVSTVRHAAAVHAVPVNNFNRNIICLCTSKLASTNDNNITIMEMR